MHVRSSIRIRCLLAVLAVFCTAAAAADEDRWAEARQQFLTAYAAASSGEPLPHKGDPKTLRRYPLYPYLQRARIARDLDHAGEQWTDADDAARRFIERHAEEPVSQGLRNVWLHSLARRHQWRQFARHFEAASADTALRCEFLQARIANGDTAQLTPLIVAEWLTADRLPPECEPPFDWLRSRGALTDELTEQRVRMLLIAGHSAFALVIARRLPDERAAPLRQWAALLDQPEREIDAVLANPPLAESTEQAALLAGWTKLARDDPPAALARYDQLAAVLQTTPQKLGPYALALALGLAWDRRAGEALNFFAKADPTELDDYALGWQARAALWARDWRRAAASIAAMSEPQRMTPRWQYWAARAAEKLGDQARAQQLYQSILPSDNFYAANAAERLDRRAEPHPMRLAEDGARLKAIEARPELVRAHELLLCGLRNAALGEWLAGVRQLDPDERSQAILLAARWQWRDVSVALATRENVFFDYALLYPRPYNAEVRAASELSAVDLPLLYAVIRQESLFRADAVSPSGAIGLAQVLPETARRIARANRQTPPSVADLLDPALNVQLGASHLRTLTDRFDGQAIVALAAYNAGPLAAEHWLPESPIDADVWIENIPYNETRDYVERVLWHSVVFGWLRSGDGQDVSWWSRPVTPHPATPGADATQSG